MRRAGVRPLPGAAQPFGVWLSRSVIFPAERHNFLLRRRHRHRLDSPIGPPYH